jgi:hypothetical protein
MSTEFNFLVMDANQPVEAQQATVRGLVTRRLNLSSFGHAEPPAAARRTSASAKAQPAEAAVE